MEIKTLDELLNEAISDAFDELKVGRTEERINAVKELVKLKIEHQKACDEASCRASEIDHEIQKMEEEKRERIEEKKIRNRLIAAIPEFLKSALVSLTMLILTILIKHYEQKGYIIKFPISGKQL